MSVVLDTNAVIHLLRGDARWIWGNDVPVSVSVITEIELLGWPGLAGEEEMAIKTFLARMIVEGITPSIKQAAIAFRRDQRLRIPDAIIAATAAVHGGTLITNDRKLLGLDVIKSLPLVMIQPESSD